MVRSGDFEVERVKRGKSKRENIRGSEKVSGWMFERQCGYLPARCYNRLRVLHL